MRPHITGDEFRARLSQLCLKGSLPHLPRKRRDRHILLKSVTLTLEAAREYTEGQINDELRFWLADIGRSAHFDHVSLRRGLVDEGYLARDRDGSRYWVAAPARGDPPFAPEVDDIDVYVSIGMGIKLMQQKKREYHGAGSTPGHRATTGERTGQEPQR